VIRNRNSGPLDSNPSYTLQGEGWVLRTEIPEAEGREMLLCTWMEGRKESQLGQIINLSESQIPHL
jgi:hypothetical protein